MVETASQCDNIFGNKLYQTRARSALPILVRQAGSSKPIYYEALAAELRMPNPRNLNYVLGSIGTTLHELSRKRRWGEIPHIQSLVINQHRRLPGQGFEGFLAERMGGYRKLSLAEKRAYLDAYWHEVYAYPYWADVLDACKLAPATPEARDIVGRAKTGRGGGGGEGEEHRRLKDRVANNPNLLGLPPTARATKEAPLPSGSNDVDLTRGLFQCVKYRAVMKAERGVTGARHSIDVLLVIGRRLPAGLRALQNSLGVEVVEIVDLH
ncbi:hypothetical protein [Rhizobium leguminosarum]|uniref:hypothetical protein n=1 Tax=Rhizobium leguminosarum TaxID=384 RepID=UPI001C9428EE|nr:hypothetical protein [Rhizobium leguminosarum]MBY5665586.1 hypothetical protein [Rhizobium leguminosarum]MBY5678884.1 hypothetical protein [Rhizobium leguminosarum]